MSQGYFYLGRPVLGIPLRVHWSLVFLIFLLGGPANPHPVRWGAVVFLILAHEYGHALVARWTGALPFSIELHGFGGLCRWDGHVSPIGRACIAWGGIWAQAIILISAIVIGAVFEPPETTLLGQILLVFVVSNFIMAALNLIPIPPLDGAEAWMLPWLLARRAWNRRRGTFAILERSRDVLRRLRLRWRTRSWKPPKGPTLH